jgi:MarR family 2-MHQ and catechol resistance regulon transcriptional repressor
MKKQSPNETVSALFTAFAMLKTRLSFKDPLFQLPMAQMETLRLIHENKKVLMKQVADFLAITPPSATVLVNNLAAAGYVQRNSDKNDRRTIHLSLTKKGSQVLQKGTNQRCKDLEKLLRNLSHNEQFELVNILQKMVRKLS